ncbi:MAG: ABC transporter permease [Candidatus Aminicenantes bacterium]|nr:ABC transporter permease [Candidatus Aminicenantes bacterium]
MDKVSLAIQELLSYKELLLNLISTELKLRYRNSVLGFLWQIINPLFYLLLLSLVFSHIIRFNIKHYPIYLFAGLASWLMIQQSSVVATGSIVNNQGLIRKIYVPKVIFPVAVLTAQYIDHVILVIILLFFTLFFGLATNSSLVLLPLIVLAHYFFSLGLSFIFASAQVKVRDVQHIVAIVFQALFYATPIIYSINFLPEKFRWLMYLNPFYYFVELLRYPVYYLSFPPIKIFGPVVGLTVAAFLLGLFIFKHREKYFVFHLS